MPAACTGLDGRGTTQAGMWNIEQSYATPLYAYSVCRSAGEIFAWLPTHMHRLFQSGIKRHAAHPETQRKICKEKFMLWLKLRFCVAAAPATFAMRFLLPQKLQYGVLKCRLTLQQMHKQAFLLRKTFYVLALPCFFKSSYMCPRDSPAISAALRMSPRQCARTCSTYKASVRVFHTRRLGMSESDGKFRP